MEKSTDMPEDYPFLRVAIVSKDTITGEYVKRSMTIDYTHACFMFWKSTTINGEKCTRAYIDNGDIVTLAIGYKAACNLIEPFNVYRVKVEVK